MVPLIHIRARREKSIRRLRELTGEEPEILLADQRYGFIGGLVKETVKRRTRDGQRLSLTDKIDRVVTNRYLGLPIFLLGGGRRSRRGGRVKGYPQPDGTATFEADRLVSWAEMVALVVRILEKKLNIPEETGLVIVLTDYVNHTVARMIKNR